MVNTSDLLNIHGPHCTEQRCVCALGWTPRHVKEFRPVTDHEVAIIKTEISRPKAQRGIVDIVDTEKWIPRLLDRIEADGEYINRLAKQNAYLKRHMTADQVIRSLLDEPAPDQV